MVRKVVFFLFLTVFCNGFSQSSDPSEAGRLLDKEIFSFAQKIQSQYGFVLNGHGGSTYPDNKIKKFKISFKACRETPFSLDESRVIIIDLMSQFLDQVNSNEEIRAYLNSYPFDFKQVSMGVLVFDLNGNYFHESSISAIKYFNQKVYLDGYKEGKGYIDNSKETIQDAVATLKGQGHLISLYLRDLHPFSDEWAAVPAIPEEETVKEEPPKYEFSSEVYSVFRDILQGESNLFRP